MQKRNLYVTFTMVCLDYFTTISLNVIKNSWKSNVWKYFYTRSVTQFHFCEVKMMFLNQKVLLYTKSNGPRNDPGKDPIHPPTKSGEF